MDTTITDDDVGDFIATIAQRFGPLKTAIVIVASCHSARGGNKIASAFLAAGCAAVMTAAWHLGVSPTRNLLEKIGENLVKGVRKRGEGERRLAKTTRKSNSDVDDYFYILLLDDQESIGEANHNATFACLGQGSMTDENAGSYTAFRIFGDPSTRLVEPST